MAKAAKATCVQHVLDLSDVDELDEISGDEQLALVWCRTCKRYEYHSVDRESLRDGAVVWTISKPL